MDRFLKAAFDEAQKSRLEGGIPIGSVLVYQGKIIGRGHNKRVQKGSPILHAEMDALENAARERSIRTLQLETGPKQLAAIELYEARGYRHIENFGPYVGDEFSVCMEKSLR